MDKSQILGAFNDHFMAFVEDVQNVFPNNMDIATVITALSKIRKANPRLTIIAFKEHVSGVYRQEIQNGDIDFFINNDYKNDLNNIGVSSPNMILEKIDCLREPVRLMSKEDQQKVIKYMQNLTKLSDLYNL
jgi:hypothetical protein